MASTGPATAQAVAADIFDQTYHLRGSDPAHIERLAAMVDGKMRLVAGQGNTVDTLRVAVLASLNLADELLLLRARYEELAESLIATHASMNTRSQSLAGMLDEVLEPEYVGVRRAG